MTINLWALSVATIQLFIITDPVGNLPIFYSLTKDQSKDERRQNFITAVMFAFSLLVVFAFLGTAILDLFKITMADFKIAGGILILIISTQILVKGTWAQEGKDFHEVGAVPIGCPLLVGPGAITTAMVSMSLNGIKITMIAIAINFVIALFTLYFGETIFKYIGKNGTAIIAKVMVILLAAIAVSFIHSGLLAWVHEFK